MQNVPEKISRMIFSPSPNFQVKFHLKLVREDSEGRKINYYSDFNYGNSMYGKIDVYPYITFELVQKNSEWSKDKSFMMDGRSIHLVIKALKKLKTNIYSSKIFAQSSKGEVIIYKDMAEKCTEQVFISYINQGIIMKPVVLYDDRDVSYEGVRIFINKLDNFVDLTIDMFEGLVYTMEKVDLFLYSQEIVNFVTSHYNKIQDEEVKRANGYKRKQIDFKPQVEQINANFRRDNEYDEIFNEIKGE